MPDAAERDDDLAAVGRLQRLVRIPTVSQLDESLTDWPSFDAFIDELARLYPRVHAALERERVAGHALLFRWPGAEGGGEAVLMAHYDVVAADDAGWTHPPFAAEITGSGEDAVIWGRGTLDDKGALVAILEAVDRLLLSGFAPGHDIYLSFGHNEETAGSGAAALVAELQRRGVRPRLVLDEGGAVVERVFPGVRRPLAVVGISEKGMANVVLTVEQTGGHASTPPRMTATVRLARALLRLNSKAFPASLVPANVEMLRVVGAHASFPLRSVFSNAAVLRRPLVALLARLGDETRAMVRTTTAVTQLSGSASANALAERASAVVNTRIAIDSSVAATLSWMAKAINDPLVRIEALTPSEPSPVSPSSGAEWDLIADSVSAVYPRAIVTPYVMLGASDSRHFASICSAVYRFTPFEMSTEERGTLHAIDERMHVATFLDGIRFYRTLIERL